MKQVLDLCAGIGGIALGFKQAGFSIHTSIDNNKECVEVLNQNFNHNIGHANLEDVNIKQFLLGIDVICAGFPCQPFSRAGNKLAFQDKRSNILFLIMDYIKMLQPKIVFLENVSNLLTISNGEVFNYIKYALNFYNYHVHYQIINTYKYCNLPQNRNRIYIVATKKNINFKLKEFTGKMLSKKRHIIKMSC